MRQQPPMVEVRCTFPGPVDPMLQRQIRESLHAFFANHPGYLTDVSGAGGWQPGSDTFTSYTSVWASNRQAFAATEDAGTWRDGQKGRFGWVSCDTVFVPERTA